MGYYINPPDSSKEEFLAAKGNLLLPAEASTFDFTSDRLPVCLVHNPGFTAAAIAYDAQEALAFSDPADNRPKRWYSVKREDLRPYYFKA